MTPGPTPLNRDKHQQVEQRVGGITRAANRAVDLGEDPGQLKGVCQRWYWAWWTVRGHAKGLDFESSLGRSLGCGPGSEGESERWHRDHAAPDMAAHLPAFPPDPRGRRERRRRLSSEPSFPEKPLSVFVLALPSPSHALLQLPSSGPKGQGRTRKSPLPSLSHFSWGLGNKAKTLATLGSPF